MRRIMNPLMLAGLLGAAIVPALAHAEPVPPANQRFATSDSTETPSFQRHVVPLMGRLGCNGRACHGSFQGQGGFRLSLFGYDFQADHDALLAGKSPRIDVKSPEQSLALQKPTRSIPHKGGKRMDKGGWEYHLLMRWIKSGAAGANAKDAEFASLEVSPREMVFDKVGQTRQLKVIAHWADGAEEDVTPLARFRSNDESIAVVSDAGLITSVGKGGTDVIAFYDNGVVPVQVILPVSEKFGANFPKLAAPTRIDALVNERLQSSASCRPICAAMSNSCVASVST